MISMPAIASLPQFVASDMDGTLLAPDHLVSTRTKSALHTLVHEYDVVLVLATGRPYEDVRIVSDNLQSYFRAHEKDTGMARTLPATYLITANGAVVHDAVTHDKVFEACLDPRIAESLYRMLPESELSINTNAYQRDLWYSRLDWKLMNEFHQESKHFYTLCTTADLPEVPTSEAEVKKKGSMIDGCWTGVTKIFFISEDVKALNVLHDEVVRRYGEALTVTFSALNCLDIMAPGVNKGEALKAVIDIHHHKQHLENGVDTDSDDAVARHNGLIEASLQRTLAFGDGLNDAEMLSIVGKGCVMGNANPLLMKNHPELEVIGTNVKDGVAEYLEKVFQLGDENNGVHSPNQ